MISNSKDLAVYRRQLALAEDALVSLHERVYHRNPRNYAVFAESYIDMILKLRAEILEDRCTPTTFGNPWPDASHLTMSFVPDGTQVGLQRPPIDDRQRG